MKGLGPEARMLEEALGRLSAWIVGIVGLVVIFFPLLPGWKALQRIGENHFLRVIEGFLLLYVAAMIKERYHLKSRFMDLMEAFDTFNATLYGKDFKVTRETITYLVTSLASKNPSVKEKAHALLVRITGEDMEPDYEKWKKWWDKARWSLTQSGEDDSEAKEGSEK